MKAPPHNLFEEERQARAQELRAQRRQDLLNRLDHALEWAASISGITPMSLENRVRVAEVRAICFFLVGLFLGVQLAVLVFTMSPRFVRIDTLPLFKGHRYN